MKLLKFSVILLTVGIFLFSCSNDDDNSNNVNNVFEQFQGNWEGTYTGGDSGDWTATIDDEGVVSGSATSTTFSQTYELNGTVSESGVFTATVGTATSGATFTGQISDDNVSGTWINEGASMSGNWQGTAQ